MEHQKHSNNTKYSRKGETNQHKINRINRKKEQDGRLKLQNINNYINCKYTKHSF